MSPEILSLDDRFRGPWFDAKTAAAYTCKTMKGWYVWRIRHGIVARANGSVAKADIDRELKKLRRPYGGGGARNPNSLANLHKRSA